MDRTAKTKTFPEAHKWANKHDRTGDTASTVAFYYLSKQGAWEGLPKGWTQESLKKFWDSLTGDVEHKVTKCMKEMGSKIDNPGAFCSSARDKVEGKGWRSEERSTS